jgi:glucose-1-phosphate adenylyltransferase
MIMAGGKGSRLGPLTTHRCKPAMPFGGRYRIIDFVLSNFVNSDYRRVYVLTQYMASSLIKHLNRTWHLGGIGEFVEVVPAQMRLGEHWYRGTADSVLQNLNLIRDSRADHIAVFGGDHIYKFAVDQMESYHRDMNADLTIAAWPVPREEAHQFGVIEVDAEGRMISFAEKPRDPKPMPGNLSMSLVSMGNYFFRSPSLQAALHDDAENPNSQHDFGKDVIPRMLAEGERIYVYDFGRNAIPGEPVGARPYWRDVGTIDSYFKANMEMRSAAPTVNLYNRNWRIRTAQRDYPPARFVRHEGRPADIEDSLVCEGSIVQGAALREVMLGYDCFARAGATIENAVILSGCDIGADAHLRGVLMDKNCTVAAGARIGVNREEDLERFPFISADGIIVLPKGTHVPRSGPLRFAYDMEQLLLNDPSTREAMSALEGFYSVSERDRHSYESAGPRYRKGSSAQSSAGAPHLLPPE